jgi:hypothetical protein
MLSYQWVRKYPNKMLKFVRCPVAHWDAPDTAPLRINIS